MQLKILISACLLGEPVRYDGRSKEVGDDILSEWQRSGHLVPICPEVAGGLAVPREPAEMQSNHRIVTKSQLDVTEAFEQGAQQAVQWVNDYHIGMAIMTDLSPSCGSSRVYDGSFSGRLISGAGMTVQRLRAAGVTVFSQHQLQQARQYWCELIGISMSGPETGN